MNIVPHAGAGRINFGMTRAEVAQAAGRPPTERIKVSALDASEIDFFGGFAVHYDPHDKCCAVEFNRDAKEVTYDGYQLFGHSADETRAWARSRDPDLELKDGFVSTALGLSMYAPFIDQPDLDAEERAAPGEGFLVFRPGYYDEERARLAAGA
jgi:hypothetical protein